MSSPGTEWNLEQLVPEAAKLGVGYSEEQLKQWLDEAIDEELYDEADFLLKTMSVNRSVDRLKGLLEEEARGRRLPVRLVPEFVQGVLDKLLKCTLEEGKMYDAKCLVEFLDAKVSPDVADELLRNALGKGFYFEAKGLMKYYAAKASQERLDRLLNDAFAGNLYFDARNLMDDFGAKASQERLYRSFVAALDKRLFQEARWFIRYVGTGLVQYELWRACSSAAREGRERDVKVLRELGANESQGFTLLNMCVLECVKMVPDLLSVDVVTIIRNARAWYAEGELPSYRSA